MTASTTKTPLDRAFALLHFLAGRRGKGARIPEICTHLEIHRVSAHRLIKTLNELGYVSQASDLSYHLGFEAWALGLSSTPRFIPEAVQRVMKQVSARTEEDVYLMRKAGADGICIARLEGLYPIRSMVLQVGTRRPLGIGATSCAILAQMPEAEARALIEANAPAYARYRQTAAEVEAIVAAARTHGYAFSKGPVIPESQTLAVPLPPLDGGAAPMSMSIVAFDSRLPESRRNELIEILRSEAATLAKS
jgi:DNA-binding IclR family transcriptional regulator